MEGLLSTLHGAAMATVTIDAEVPSSHPSVPVLGPQRYGTGVVVDDAGYVLTVLYVVLGAGRITVTDVHGNEFEAEAIVQDFATGLAVLSVRAAVLPAIQRGDSSKCKPGDDVFTVASLGGPERRAASGFISSVEPFDAYWEYLLERALWASCPNPGLGGAPLCDSSGGLCGIISLNLGGVGRASVSVPAEHWYDHVEELLRHGRRVSRAGRAWVGMFCYAADERPVVAGLIPGSPGAEGGLVIGDVILRLDEQQLHGRAALYEELWRRRPGDIVALKVLRSGSVADVVVRTGDAEEFFAVRD